MLIIPMREDLTRHGLEEARTPADVEPHPRPGERHRPDGDQLGLRLRGRQSPSGHRHHAAQRRASRQSRHRFRRADEAAVAHLRAILSDYPPSSPSIALFKNGKPVYVMHRSDIESRDAVQIANLLTQAFNKFCVRETVNS